MDGVSIGRTVHYVATPQDADEVTRRRVRGAGASVTWPAGAQAHVGNALRPGAHVAMTITDVHGDEGMINGQAILDGNDSMWVTSASYSEDPQEGSWHWPERA